MHEVLFALNGKTIKKIQLEVIKGVPHVQVLELKLSEFNKKYLENFVPTHFKIHRNYHDAKMEWLGLICQNSYENGNIE